MNPSFAALEPRGLICKLVKIFEPVPHLCNRGGTACFSGEW